MAQDASPCNQKVKIYLGSQASPVFSTPVHVGMLRQFLKVGTAAAFKSDSIIEGRVSIKAADSAQKFHPAQISIEQGINNRKEINMKKLLFIALVATGLLLVPIHRSNAQVTVGVGGVGVGYPGYGYGYYPYGYYRPYPYYGYYSGPSYYWYNGHRYYRHYRHHHRYYHQY